MVNVAEHYEPLAVVPFRARGSLPSTKQGAAEEIAHVNARLLRMVRSGRMPPKSLLREIRKLAVLMVVSACNGHERKEAVRLLADIEGWKWAARAAPVASSDETADRALDAELERI